LQAGLLLLLLKKPGDGNPEVGGFLLALGVEGIIRGYRRVIPSMGEVLCSSMKSWDISGCFP
jgi:hypothetical protein